jgi:inorganic triphosphatase YgiF
MNEEIELKLAVAPEHVERLRRHPMLRAHTQKRASTTRLVSTYYDTPAFALKRKAVALRVRKIGQAHIQSIKSEASPDRSRISRREWEKPVSGNRPDLSQLEDPELRKLIEPDRVNGSLKPVFVTDVTRQVWPLRLGASRIECAIDVGEIKADGKREPLCEVELELKSGAPAKLFELARSLNRSVPLRLEPESKAARGYSLAAGKPSVPRKAASVHLDPRMTVSEAFATIARGCIAHILANVDCAHEGKNPEGVHQLRVGIRRLRAAFSVFKDAIPPAEREALGGGLKWLQRELGPAREWDVFIDTTLRTVAKRLSAGESFDALVRAAEALRGRAYERARAALNDKRYTDLLLHLEAWVDGRLVRRQRPPRNGEATVQPAAVAGTEPIADFAAAVLRLRHAKAHKLGGKMRKLGDDEIHELRIRVKKLRYAMEYFRDLYPEKAVRRYVARLKALQDVLGTAHDALVAEDLIPQLESGGRDVGRALGQLQGWCAAELKSDRKQLLRLWQDFARIKPFWKDA